MVQFIILIFTCIKTKCTFYVRFYNESLGFEPNTKQVFVLVPMHFQYFLVCFIQLHYDVLNHRKKCNLPYKYINTKDNWQDRQYLTTCYPFLDRLCFPKAPSQHLLLRYVHPTLGYFYIQIFFERRPTHLFMKPHVSLSRLHESYDERRQLN